MDVGIFYFSVLSTVLLKAFYSPNSSGLFSFENQRKMMSNTCEK